MKSQQEYMKNVRTIYLFSQFQLNFHSMSFPPIFVCFSHSRAVPHRYDLLNQSMRKQRCFFMQVGQQRAPVADCFHRRSYLFMLSHFHFSDMIVFLTHQPFIIQKSSNIHFFFHNPFHGIFRWNNSVQCLPHLLSVTSEDWFQYFYVMMNFCFQRKHLRIGFKKLFSNTESIYGSMSLAFPHEAFCQVLFWVIDANYRESAKVQSAKGLRFALSACGFGWLLLLDEVVPLTADTPCA